MTQVVKNNPVSFHQFGLLLRFSPPSHAIKATNWGRPTFYLEWVMPQRKNPFHHANLGLATLQFLIQTMEIILNHVKHWLLLILVCQPQITKHGGRPHWGKNGLALFNQAFFGPNYGNRDHFISAIHSFDPHSIFSYRFRERLLGVGNDMD